MKVLIFYRLGVHCKYLNVFKIYWFSVQVIYHILYWNLFLTACADIRCTERFTKCYKSSNKSEDAQCRCLPAYISINNTCTTSPNIVEVQAFKLNKTFQKSFSDLSNPATVEFIAPLQDALRRTLNLKDNEYVKILKLSSGSIFVDFIVLLRNDTSENQATVYQKLYDEVKTNATGNLVEYFPVAEQVVVVVGKLFVGWT